MYWLGIDIGTGGSRALLVDENGKIKASYTALHEDMQMLKPLWAEQHPDDWWRAAQEAIQGVLKEAGVTGADVRGIGLSGQMHGLTLLDDASKVIRPALIWCDQRSQKQVDWINNTLGPDFVLQQTANPVVTGFTLPKLLWIRDNEPDHYARVRHILLPKDYIRFRLTGEYATEVSDASGTSLFDVVKRNWAWPLADKLDIDRSVLPDCYESADITGTLRPDVANILGLKPGTPVVGGGGDQAASAVGNGIVESGIMSCTLGTSGVVFAHMDEPHYDPKGRVHTFCHAVRGKWHVMGVTQGAGLSLQWFRNQLAPGEEYPVLTRAAAQTEVGAQGLFWLPYLMGERTPHLDASVRASFIGLTAKHTRADMVRAVIEGVSYSQKDGLDIIEGMGVPVKSIRISGGGAKSPFWRRVLADILNKPCVSLETQEGSAYGAALLALVGTGAFPNVEAACREAIREVDTTEPDAKNASFYSQAHRIYQAIYPALKPIYEQIQ